MNLVKKTFVLGIVAFWALMSSHCALEIIPGLEFLACSPQGEAAAHQPTDCGDAKDACATVESGLYKCEESRIAVPRSPSVSEAFAVAISSGLAALETSANRVLPELAPPELAVIWQFSFRAALPPRAPSIAS